LWLLAVLAAMSVPTSLSAQHYLGVKGGYGAAWGLFYPTPAETPWEWGKYNSGGAWKYYSPQLVVGGVSVELEYQTRGYTTVDPIVPRTPVSDTTSWYSNTRTVRSITMPIIWQPHLYFAKQRIRVFANAGVTFTYNLGVNETFTRYEHLVDAAGKVTETSVTSEYRWNNARDSRLGYGICLGGGVGVLLGPCEMFAEARWYMGMSDILRTKTRYQFNDYIRSELSNLYFNVGIFFKISKGGITEPPLRFKRAPDRIRDDDFRNIKLNTMKY
jgi:hypothetical protein